MPERSVLRADRLRCQSAARVSVSSALPPETLAALDALAWRLCLTRADLIARLLSDALELLCPFYETDLNETDLNEGEPHAR